MIDRLRFSVSSAAPRQDAATLREALRAPTSDWPIPGKWRIGFKRGLVILHLDVPWSPVTRYERVGLFRWRPYTIDDTQLPFAFEQLRHRWPESIPMPKPRRESV